MGEGGFTPHFNFILCVWSKGEAQQWGSKGGREGAREGRGKGGREAINRKGGGGEAITRGKANLIIDKPDMETCGLNKIQKAPGGLIWFP